MFATTRRIWKLSDSVDKEKTNILLPGRHELERIPNPHGYKGSWFIVKGTTIGASEGFWRDWGEEEYGSTGFQITIEE